MRVMKVDVAIVGAGSSGSAAAAQCASRGLLVALVEARPLGLAGADWVCSVPAWQFEEAGIPAPRGEELLGRGRTRRLQGGPGQPWISLDTPPLLELDMRLLVARLQQAARGSGALVYPETRVTGWDGRLLQTTAGGFEADWVVDASGLGGAALLGQPAPAPTQVARAAQQLRQVRYPRQAAAFLARHQAAEGQVLLLHSHAGRGTELSLRLEGEQLFLQASGVPALGGAPGPELLRRLAADNAWIGEQRRGVERVVPLRRPHDRLARERTALLGDAACQVSALHGAGAGLGLVAARMLADALTEGRGVAGYAAAFQRRHGGTLAALSLLRRRLLGLHPDRRRRLLSSGLVPRELTQELALQRLRRPPLPALLRWLRRAPRQRQLAAWILGLALDLSRVQAHYRRYPQDAADLERWTAGLRDLGFSTD